MTHRAPVFAALLGLAVLLSTSGSIADGLDRIQPAATAAPGSHALPAGVLDSTWQWTWFGSGAEQFEVDHPERYTLQFSADGNLAIQADCNRGRAGFTVAAAGRISISPVAKTMMLCPEGSLDGKFVQALERVRTYFEKDGDFFLEIPLDSGTLRFRRESAD